MTDAGKIYHTLKSKAGNIRNAVELLQKYPPEKKHEIIVLMREAAQDIVKLLAELEAEPGH